MNSYCTKAVRQLHARFSNLAAVKGEADSNEIICSPPVFYAAKVHKNRIAHTGYNKIPFVGGEREKRLRSKYEPHNLSQKDSIETCDVYRTYKVYTDRPRKRTWEGRCTVSSFEMK